MSTKAPTAPTLGDRILKARIASNLTQQELAHKCGLSGEGAGAYLSRVEAGRQEPRMSMLRRIARHCGVLLSDLVDE